MSDLLGKATEEIEKAHSIPERLEIVANVLKGIFGDSFQIEILAHNKLRNRDMYHELLHHLQDNNIHTPHGVRGGREFIMKGVLFSCVPDRSALLSDIEERLGE